MPRWRLAYGAVHWHAPAAPTRWGLVLLDLSSTISFSLKPPKNLLKTS
jgi:hypothetical protein